jgi:hypothetical protein
MALSVNLPDEIAARLKAEAEARGVGIDEVAAELLEAHFALKRQLSFAASGRSTSGRTAAEAEDLLAEGGFGTDGADR